MYSLGASPLPPTAPDSFAAGGLQTKFEQYSDPAKYGVTLNTEGLAFQQAVQQGFVPNTPEGLGTFLMFVSMATPQILAAGLWDWFAFRTRFISLVPVSSLPMIAQNIGTEYPEAVKALEAQYQQSIVPLPPPPSQSLPTPVPAPSVSFTAALQICFTKQVPPSPGDGINFATVCWRSIEQGSDNSWRATGPWVSWKGSFVHYTNDPRLVLLDVDDVLYEATHFQGVPGREGPMWDVGTLRTAIDAAGSSPPPALAAPVVTPPEQVRPAIPSGSIPVPDEPHWTDATAMPPAPSGLLEPEPGPRGVVTLPPPSLPSGPSAGGAPTSGVYNDLVPTASGGMVEVGTLDGSPVVPSQPTGGLWLIAGLAAAAYFATKKR